MKRTVSEEYGIPLFPPSPVSTPVDGANAASNGAGSTQPGVHPYTVRKAALALQRKRDQMPEARRQELESLIASFTTAVEPWVAEMVGEITAEAGTASGVVYSPPMLWAALLAGMSSQSRRRTIRRWIGEGQALPDALVAELEDADVRAGRSASAFGSNAAGQDARALGHMSHAWHGLRVVEAAAAQGGEAEIAALCARFRKVFVDALQPRYLPVGWEVDHKAPRAFGPHSVYAPAAFHGRAGVAEGDDGPSKQQETIEDA